MAVKGKKCQDLKSVGWISSSFSDSFGFSADEIPAEKRIKLQEEREDFDLSETNLISIENEFLKVKDKSSEIKVSKRFNTWCDKYKPKKVDDLVINKKKVSELESWLRNVFRLDNCNVESKILLITGPTGCGKLCTLKVLCDFLGINIIEWITPLDVDCDHKEYGSDSYKPWQKSGMQSFSDFIVRSSKYCSVLSFDNDDICDRKIVLVKDIPNIFYDKPEIFHEILSKYYENCNSDFHVSPIVFIFSCSNIIRELFPDELKYKLNVTTINFNPVTDTNIIKALNRILLIESKNNPLKFKMPTKDDLVSLSDSCDGDIRSAILKLQFNLDNCGSFGLNNSFKVPKSVSNHQKRVKVKKSSSSKNKVCEIDKDKKLDFFNSIGRVLYPKKEIIGSTCGANNSKINFKFVHSPDAIVDSFLVEPNKFINMLHENYLDRFTNIKDVSVAADSLSISDFMMSSCWEGRNVLVEYGLSNVVRTLMSSNSSPAPNSWKPLSKSKIWTAENSRLENLRAIRSVFPDVQSEKDVLLDVIPLIKNFSVYLTPEQDKIISKIASYK